MICKCVTLQSKMGEKNTWKEKLEQFQEEFVVRIIRENDNLADIVVESVLDAAKSEGFELRDRDVISVTESIVARAQGNYASIDAIAEDVKAKLGGRDNRSNLPNLIKK